MKRNQTWCSTVFALSATLLASGCCKESPDNSEQPTKEPAAAAADKTVTSTDKTVKGTDKPLPTPAAPTPTAASTDAYQSNGFPAAMPKTRTPVPKVPEWQKAPTLTTKKLPDGCTMKFVREWLKINCSKDTNTATPLGISGITGLGSQGADYFKFEKSGKVLDLVFRTKDGKKGSAVFQTDRGNYTVGYNWPYRAPFPSTVFQ